MTEEVKSPPLESWCVLEMMGHIRLGGKVTEENHFGVVMGRIDIPQEDGKWITQFFGGSAVFRITPCDEATARAVAATSRPAPIQPYEMPKLVHSRVADPNDDRRCRGCGFVIEDCECQEEE